MRLTLRAALACFLTLVGGIQAFGQFNQYQSPADFRRVSATRNLADDSAEAPAVPSAGESNYAAGGACDTCGPCAGGGGFVGGGGYVPPCEWFERFRVYGEFLYIRPRNAEVAYGVIANSVNGPVPGTPLTEVGRVGVVDIDYTPAFRAGFTFIIDPNNSISAQYTRFQGDTFNQLVGNANNRVATSLVFDPSIQSAQNQTSLLGESGMQITYDLIDIDYRNLLYCDSETELVALAGVRYGRMEQLFDAQFSGQGVGYAATEIDFEGIGTRFGFEAEKRLGRANQFFVTGKSYVGLMAGEFRADYRGGNAFNDIELQTDWRAGRLVTTLDFELGVGWRSVNDTFRIQVGYLFNNWYNVVKTQEWINAVQNSNYVDPSTNFNGFMSFDGLTARAEFRF